MFAKQGNKNNSNIHSSISAKNISSKNKNFRSKKEYGIGAEVKLIKPFGINDVPLGTKGVIIDHTFGRESPTVKFHGIDFSRRVVKPEMLEVIKSSNKFNPTRYDKLKVYGTRKELINEIKKMNYKFSNISDDGWASSYLVAFDEGGYQIDIPYSIKVNDNEVEIHVKKQDIPNSHKSYYDEFREEAEMAVRSALGMSD